MKKSLYLLSLLTMLLFVFCPNTYAIDADIVVALDGSGDFTKIQAAIDAVPSNQSARRTVIFIKNGEYNTEKLIIPSDKKNVTLIGESRDQTIISYHIYDCTSPESGNKCPAADVALWSGDVIRTSATLTINGEGFRAENLTVRNTAGPVGQALALTITADKTVFINCDILGYQDTIYLWTAGKRSFFKNCLVLGRTDYIYGAGIAFFESCEIRSYGGGWITAPSTPKSQAYGYVFNNCQLTYATGSPRNGDDGASVRFGRPWHEYPKVAWLNCEMTGKINPAGWGDTWRMDYAATSSDLHLYEYNNTGAGADMSKRANWAGIKELTASEAANYTAAKVLNGSDGWAPYAEAPLVTSYEWDGMGSDKNWLTAENWSPDGQPAAAEVANVVGKDTVEANGGSFLADLNLKNGAVLNITDASSVIYMTGEDAIITAEASTSLAGKIATKDTITISIATDIDLLLDAQLFGIHKIIKKGAGTTTLKANNTNFSGLFVVKEGTLHANVGLALGKANVEVKTGAILTVEYDNSFFPEAWLKVETGATLNLNANVTLSEFYIDGKMQDVGGYNATTHPNLIKGDGAIVVGRPSSFLFNGGTWDNISGYTPAMLPEAGETVFCEGEMETSSVVNAADVIFVESKGKLRLRGTHKSTGTLTFEGNQRISYATGGTGFTLEAPIVINDDISLEMNSGNSKGSTMTLKGSISGSPKITVRNTKSGLANTSKVWLGGDNSNFSGRWDVTTAASTSGGVVGIVGASKNAFGTGSIVIGVNNFVQFDHADCVLTNEVTLAAGAKAIVNKSVSVGSLTLGGTTYDSGVFDAQSHSAFIQGAGTITVGSAGVDNHSYSQFKVVYQNSALHFEGDVESVKIIAIDGTTIKTSSVSNNTLDVSLLSGLYLIVNQNRIVRKLVVNDL